MQPLSPLDERERRTDYLEKTPSAWGAVLALVVLVALVLVAFLFLGGGGADEGAPAEPAPTEAPVQPGEGS